MYQYILIYFESSVFTLHFSHSLPFAPLTSLRPEKNQFSQFHLLIIPTLFSFSVSSLYISTKLNYFHRSMTAVENCDHCSNLTCLAAVPFVAIGSDANRKAIGYFGSALYFDDDRPVALIQVNDTYCG